MFFVYILRTSSNTLYVGQTNNFEKRMKEHRSHTGRSAKYLRYFASFDVVYSEQVPTRSDALKREHFLKSLTKKQKEQFVRDHGTIKSYEK